MSGDSRRDDRREQQREHERRLGTEAAGRVEVPEGASPTVRQPINGEPRSPLGPVPIVVGLVVLAVVVILALTLIGPMR